jgi:Topoisomerase IB
MGELHYVNDDEPGIRRKPRGKGFTYTYADGRPVRSPQVLARIRKLAIPPAYGDVWICANELGHLQATGIDARGRKQYRYHPDWEVLRSANKFERLAEFGRALPKIRATIRRDLKNEESTERRILAVMAELIDKARLRIGNHAYARENRTYGATTLLKRHVRLEEDDVIRLRFRGKGGTTEEYELRSRALYDALEEISDLPGRELFAFPNGDGALRKIDSGAFNAYLAEIAAPGMTAKTFRTWGGSVSAFEVACAALDGGAPIRVAELCAAAAEHLHNTPAVCRTSYIHPAVVSLCEAAPSSQKAFAAAVGAKGIRGLMRIEARFLAFLEALQDA